MLMEKIHPKHLKGDIDPLVWPKEGLTLKMFTYQHVSMRFKQDKLRARGRMIDFPRLSATVLNRGSIGMIVFFCDRKHVKYVLTEAKVHANYNMNQC